MSMHPTLKSNQFNGEEFQFERRGRKKHGRNYRKYKIRQGPLPCREIHGNDLDQSESDYFD